MRYSKIIVTLIILFAASTKMMAQSYVLSGVKDAYYLFAEKMVFYPDFNYATNSSVGLESFINENGECDFRIVIDGQTAPIYAVRTKVHDNGYILDIWFEDRNGFRALMRVTLLSNGKMRMYFPPEKTETADIFVYGFNQERTYGYTWYEPTLKGLSFHPDAQSGQEATKNYYTHSLSKSFNDYINSGKRIIEGQLDIIREAERQRELARQEARRKEEERKRKEEEEKKERYRRENTVLVTIAAPQSAKGAIIEINDNSQTNGWQDSLLVGTYTVICRCEHFETLTQTITVTKQNTHFVLNKMIPLKRSFIFKSPDSENGAQVYVNDVYVGKTPIKTKVNWIVPNKVVYLSPNYTTRQFYLTTDSIKTSIWKGLDRSSQNETGVTETTPSSVTVKMGKSRRGGIDSVGNFYVYLSGSFSSYTTYGYGIDVCATYTGLSFDLSLYNIHLDYGYTHLQTGARIGLPWNFDYFRITPQIGIDFDWNNKNDEWYRGHSNDLGLLYIPLGVRFEFALFKWITFAITPEISWNVEDEDLEYGIRFNLSLFNIPYHNLPD